MDASAIEFHKLDPDRIIERVEGIFLDNKNETRTNVVISGMPFSVRFMRGSDEVGRIFEYASYEPYNPEVVQEELEDMKNTFAFSETADFNVMSYEKNSRELKLDSVRIIESYAVYNDQFRVEMTRYEAKPQGEEMKNIERISIREKGVLICLFDYPYSGLHNGDLSTMLASLEL